MTDYEKFSNNFLDEEKEILVLIEQSTDGAMKFGELWRPCNLPLAFIDLETNKLTNRKCRLEWLVEGKNWKYYFEPKKAYRLKVRPEKPTEKGYVLHTFMLLEVLEENIENQKFDKILAKYEKDVFFKNEYFNLKLNKKYECFEGEEIGKAHEITVETDNLKKLQKLLNQYKTLTQDFQAWEKKLKDFACEKLLTLANEWQKEYAITAKDFKERIKLKEVILDFDDAYFNFSDDDIFLGHCICVVSDLKGKLKNAYFEG